MSSILYQMTDSQYNIRLEYARNTRLKPITIRVFAMQYNVGVLQLTELAGSPFYASTLVAATKRAMDAVLRREKMLATRLEMIRNPQLLASRPGRKKKVTG